MKFYCTKWGKLFRRRTWVGFLKVLLWSIPYWVFVFFVNVVGAADDKYTVGMILAAILIILLVLIALIVGNKRQFISVEENRVSWQEALLDPDRRYSRYHHNKFTLSTIKVKNIRNIVFKQTAIERYFNMGRISFDADISSVETIAERNQQVVYPEPPFEFSGIKSFRRFKEYLHQQLSPSAFQSLQ